MTARKICIVNNATLHCYLRSSLSAAALQECELLFGLTEHQNDHSWGSLFEGLLWLAHIRKQSTTTTTTTTTNNAESIVQHLMEFCSQGAVREGVDEIVQQEASKFGINENLDDDDDDDDDDNDDDDHNELEKTIAKRMKTLLLSMFETRESTATVELQQAKQSAPEAADKQEEEDDDMTAQARYKAARVYFRDMSIDDSVLNSHRFERTPHDDVATQPQACTIANRPTLCTWEGAFCQLCHAMLVRRRVTKSRSEYFIIGERANCRTKRPSSSSSRLLL
jgi:hypothetical protein